MPPAKMIAQGGVSNGAHAGVKVDKKPASGNGDRSNSGEFGDRSNDPYSYDAFGDPVVIAPGS